MKRDTKLKLINGIAGAANNLMHRVGDLPESGPRGVASKPPRNPMKGSPQSKQKRDQEVASTPAIMTTMFFIREQEEDSKGNNEYTVDTLNLQIPLHVAADGEQFIKGMIQAAEASRELEAGESGVI
jgi:hypothetical protein